METPPVTATETGPGDPSGVPTDDGEATAPTERRRGRGLAFELLWLVPVAVIAALLIKSFVFQAFYIPSGSMEPTLQIGDRVLVNKLSYDLHGVNRGDIIVFDAPDSARTDGIEDLVKRVIGLPGDTVTYSGGSVLINGRRLDEPYLPRGARTQALDGIDVPPGCRAPANGQAGCRVPKDYLFVLGDNREASKDARVFGAIPESTIVGRVFVRIWPFDSLGFF